MAKKTDVLNFAFNRLYDEVKNNGDYQYWRAYIDGAKAQKMEDEDIHRSNARLLTDVAELNEQLENMRELLDKHDIRYKTDLDGEEDE